MQDLFTHTEDQLDHLLLQHPLDLCGPARIYAPHNINKCKLPVSYNLNGQFSPNKDLFSVTVTFILLHRKRSSRSKKCKSPKTHT